LRSIWLRARLDTAPRFCGLEIGNAVPHHRLRGIPKGGRTASHTPRRPRPSASRADWAVRLALQAVENRVYLSEPVLRVSVSLYTNPPERRARGGPPGVEITRTSEPNGRNRNGQSARLDTNFRPQNYGAVGKTLLATTMMAEFCNFSMGSTFRAIGQSPTRNALVSEIRRDCKGLQDKIESKRQPYSVEQVTLILTRAQATTDDIFLPLLAKLTRLPDIGDRRL